MRRRYYTLQANVPSVLDELINELASEQPPEQWRAHASSRRFEVHALTSVAAPGRIVLTAIVSRLEEEGEDA